jgi:hypothetical protein
MARLRLAERDHRVSHRQTVHRRLTGHLAVAALTARFARPRGRRSGGDELKMRRPGNDGAEIALESGRRMTQTSSMDDPKTLSLLERRVREVERLAADCMLDTDVRRVEQMVSQYCETAKMPPVKARGFSWLSFAPRSAFFGWRTA